MKIISKNLCYLILVTLFSSCTGSKYIFKKFDEKENINTNNWVAYKQPENGKNLSASINDKQIVIKSITNDLSIGYNLDSIEINPKFKIRNKEIIIKTDTSKKNNINSKIENNQIKKTETKSLLSFVLSILGFIPLVNVLIEGFDWWDLGFNIGMSVLALLGFISAIILGKSVRKKIKENPKKYNRKIFAIIGEILGIIGGVIALFALTISLLILLFIIILLSFI